MYDLIIVGGGISGLYLYYKLLNTGKNIILLEKNDRYGGRILQHTEKINGEMYSFPAGAARFNSNHVEVIKLLKELKLLDFRKDKGGSSSIDFVDSNNNFPSKFDNKNGFVYINKILDKAKGEEIEKLRKYTFQEYAKRHLKKEELEYMLIASGYSGQLKNMNMYDAYHLFSKGIRTDMQYYSGYYHHMIDALVKKIKESNGILKQNSDVKLIDYDSKKENYVVSVNNKEIKSKQIALCLPKESLLSFSFLNPIRNILEKSISCKSLCRVYALFNKEDIWFKDLKKKVITDNKLRYVIPMNVEKGLIMISYTDDKYTKYWNSMKTEKEVKNAIVKNVKLTFKKEINAPEKVWVFNWDCGVGYWNKGIDSNKVANQITNPCKNLYICGENYSLTQSWVEGSLESCNRCLITINKNNHHNKLE